MEEKLRSMAGLCPWDFEDRYGENPMIGIEKSLFSTLVSRFFALEQEFLSNSFGQRKATWGYRRRASK
jgi:hypothetical protein